VNWEQLKSVLASTPDLVGAWVFGSAQHGDVRTGSDLDIGLWFASAPVLDTLTMLRANLQLALGIEAIDLVVLNDASPIVRFEAVSGRRVVCRDRASCAAFVSLTAREYESAMALLARGLRQKTQP
jgi:predicted nucleotidyltransferase